MEDDWHDSKASQIFHCRFDAIGALWLSDPLNRWKTADIVQPRCFERIKMKTNKKSWSAGDLPFIRISPQ